LGTRTGGATLASFRYHFSPLYFVREIEKLVEGEGEEDLVALARARSGRRLAILSGFGGSYKILLKYRRENIHVLDLDHPLKNCDSLKRNLFTPLSIWTYRQPNLHHPLEMLL
jgi:hypothetical protein